MIKIPKRTNLLEYCLNIKLILPEYDKISNSRGAAPPLPAREIVIDRSGAPLLFPEQDIGNNSDVSYILYLEQTVNLPCS